MLDDSNHGSVTQLIRDLNLDQPSKAQEALWNQYFRRLVALARHKLGLESIRHAITRSLFGESGALERNAAFLAAASYGVAISHGALQVHGGMGFTWDVPIHRHLRRILALQAQGDASGLLRALGHGYVSEIEPASEAAA